MQYYYISIPPIPLVNIWGYAGVQTFKPLPLPLIPLPLSYLTLHKSLPPEFHHKLHWFNSDLSNKYKDDETGKLTQGETWELFTTDYNS